MDVIKSAGIVFGIQNKFWTKLFFGQALIND